MVKIKFLILLLFSELMLGQQIDLNIDKLMFLGKVPQKNASNILVDKLDYILSDNKDSIAKIGYLNTEGKIMIKPIFNMGYDYYCDYANVIKDSVHGIVDKNGNVKYYKQYNKVFFYNNDVGIAKKGKKAALINKNGEKITDFIYSNIDIYGYDFFRGFMTNEESYILNKEGKRIFKLNLNIRSHFLVDSILIYERLINNKKKYGLLNINGDTIMTAKYDQLSSFFDKNGLMLVTDNGKQGYLDRSGKIKIPLEYSVLKNGLSEGLIAAKKNEKWGFIDENNSVIIPFIYDDAQGFSSGLALVKKDNNYGYIDRNNKIKIPFKFKETKYSFFIEDRAVFKDTISGKYGFINRKGKVVVKPIYNMVLPFYNNKAFVRIDNKEGFIDKNGEEVIPIIYKQLWMERNEMIRFVK